MLINKFTQQQYLKLLSHSYTNKSWSKKQMKEDSFFKDWFHVPFPSFIWKWPERFHCRIYKIYLIFHYFICPALRLKLRQKSKNIPWKSYMGRVLKDVQSSKFFTQSNHPPLQQIPIWNKRWKGKCNINVVCGFIC